MAGGKRYLRRKHLWGCTSSSFQLGGGWGGRKGLGGRKGVGEIRGMERRRVSRRGEEREKMRCYER